jgi:hypothetical protein
MGTGILGTKRNSRNYFLAGSYFTVKSVFKIPLLSKSIYKKFSALSARSSSGFFVKEKLLLHSSELRTLNLYKNPWSIPVKMSLPSLS